MTRLPEALALFAALTLLPGLPRADQASGGADAATPTTAPPTTPPPPAPSTVPAPPAQAGRASDSSVPPGQWVYTAQYGWIWMPYADAYTYVPPSGYGEPYVYAYYPIYGWTWIIAPWIWGWGPWPYFGFYGPARFGWYGHGWWRDPGRWRWGAPYRSGSPVGVRPAPYLRGGSVYGRALVGQPAPSGARGGWSGGGSAGGGHRSGGRR